MAILQIQPFSINTSAAFTFANLTITGNLTSGNANLGNLATANYFAGVLTTAAQPNITSLGTLSSISVTGNITSGNANLGNLATANYFTGVLTTAAQPNITSTGTLSGIVGTGTINFTGASNVALGAVGNVHITGGSSGQYLQTDGSGNLSWASISSGSLSNGNSNISILGNANINFSSAGNANVVVITGTGVNVSGTLNATGNVTAGNINTGGIANITNTTQATGTGTGALIVQGGASVTKDLYVGGNLYVPNLISTNSTTLTVQDPLLYLAADTPYPYSYDIGFYSHYATSSGSGAGNGYQHTGFVRNHSDNAWYLFSNLVEPSGGTLDLSNANIVYDSVKVGNITSLNANLGNAVNANYFIGSGNNLSNIQGGNVSGQVGNALVAGTVYTNAQPNITSVGTLASLSVTANITSGNASLGNAVTANYFIGSGANLSAIAGANVTGTVANANYAAYAGNVVNASQSNITSVGTLTSLSVTGNITSGNASLGNLITANYSTAVLTTGAQPNITSVGTLASLSVTANITAGNVYANSGTIGAANLTGTLTTGAQPNITSVGTLSSLSVTGNISSGNANLGNLATANYFSGSGNLLSNIQGANVSGAVGLATYATTANAVAGANVSGQVSNALVAGTVYTNAQPNITSVGTLNGLTATSTVNFTGASNVALGAVGNVHITGGTSGQYLSTDGSGGLSWATISTSVSTISNGTSNLSIPTSGGNVDISVAGNANVFVVTGTGVNVSGTLNTTGNLTSANANLGNVVTANYTNAVLTTGAQPNITSTGTLTSLTVTANITSGNASLGNAVTANYFIGSGANLTAIAGANVTGQVGNALVAGTVYTNAQPNITSLGTLSSLVVTGDTTVTGNLVVTGNTTYINSNVSVIQDPIVEYGGGANGAALSTNDSKDRGSLLHYYAGGAAVDAFMGWKNGNSEFVFASNANVTTNVVTVNTLGNIRVGNAQLGNAATANYFIGSGNNLSNIQGANVTGQVGNALVAGTVYTNAQPNITSVGSLASLTVAGLVSLQGIGNIYLPGGSANYLIKTDGSGNLSWAPPAASGNANIAGSNTQIFFNNAGSNTLGASANLTFNNSTNTLTTTNLVVNGTTNLGAVGNVTITGGSSNQYMKTDGSGTLSWASLPSTTVTVDSFTGDGSNVAFTLTATPTSVNYTIVAVGGVFQPRSAYTVSGTTLTFSSAPPNTATIEVTTINSGVSVSSGGGGGGTGYTYSGISANTTLAKSTKYIVNTSSANLTLTLPSNATSTLGDEIGIIDGTGNANTHAITITVSGGGNIMGNSGDLVINTSRAALTLVYYNSTQGWLLTNV